MNFEMEKIENWGVVERVHNDANRGTYYIVSPLPLTQTFLSFSLQMPVMRCVMLVLLICCCLLETLATSGRTRHAHPRGFNDNNKYFMEGKRIIMTERQECRVHCTKEYFTCFEGKRCHMKQNEHRIEECKEEYNECMRRCLDMIRRLENDEFPPPRSTKE